MAPVTRSESASMVRGIMWTGPFMQLKHQASSGCGTCMMYTAAMTLALVLPAGFGRIGRLVARCHFVSCIVPLSLLRDVC